MKFCPGAKQLHRLDGHAYAGALWRRYAVLILTLTLIILMIVNVLLPLALPCAISCEMCGAQHVILFWPSDTDGNAGHAQTGDMAGSGAQQPRPSGWSTNIVAMAGALRAPCMKSDLKSSIKKQDPMLCHLSMLTQSTQCMQDECCPCELPWTGKAHAAPVRVCYVSFRRPLAQQSPERKVQNGLPPICPCLGLRPRPQLQPASQLQRDLSCLRQQTEFVPWSLHVHAPG